MIKIDCVPELVYSPDNHMKIYLRGDNHNKDFLPARTTFESNEKRDKFYDVVDMALSSVIESLKESLKEHE